MSSEFQRFLVLFEQLALFNEAWLDKMPADRLDWAPIENSSMKFGDRVSRITVKGLMVHVTVGECHWVEGIRSNEDGAVIPIPKDKPLEEALSSGDWRQNLRRSLAENLGKLRGFGSRELEKTVIVKFRLFIDTLAEQFRFFLVPVFKGIDWGDMSKCALRDVVVVSLPVVVQG